VVTLTIWSAVARIGSPVDLPEVSHIRPTSPCVLSVSVYESLSGGWYR
jgi:hypothetical protein